MPINARRHKERLVGGTKRLHVRLKWKLNRIRTGTYVIVQRSSLGLSVAFHRCLEVRLSNSHETTHKEHSTATLQLLT